MLYLQNPPASFDGSFDHSFEVIQPQTLLVPRDNRAAGTDGQLVFCARNTVDLTDAFELEVAGILVGDFVQISVTIPANLASGSYEYTLTNAQDAVISAGILMIGDFEADVVAFEKKPTFVQFNGK